MVIVEERVGEIEGGVLVRAPRALSLSLSLSLLLLSSSVSVSVSVSLSFSHFLSLSSVYIYGRVLRCV